MNFKCVNKEIKHLLIAVAARQVDQFFLTFTFSEIISIKEISSATLCSSTYFSIFSLEN